MTWRLRSAGFLIGPSAFTSSPDTGAVVSYTPAGAVVTIGALPRPRAFSSDITLDLPIWYVPPSTAAATTEPLRIGCSVASMPARANRPAFCAYRTGVASSPLADPAWMAVAAAATDGRTSAAPVRATNAARVRRSESVMGPPVPVREAGAIRYIEYSAPACPGAPVALR